MEYSNMFDVSHNMTYPYAIDMNRNIDNFEESRHISLEEAIKKIKNSITGEKDDEIFYSVLLSQAPTEEDRKVILSIIEDEKKHNKMFKILPIIILDTILNILDLHYLYIF